MGIYLFNRDVLVQSLVQDAEQEDSEHDFGRNVIPQMLTDPAKKVYAYPFGGYWRDVGTIESYYQANMDLLVDIPDLNLYDPETRVRTRVTGYPPAKIGRNARIFRSLLELGCIINGQVEHSVLSPGVYVEEGAVVRDSIIFDDCRIEAGAMPQHERPRRDDKEQVEQAVFGRELCGFVGFSELRQPRARR